MPKPIRLNKRQRRKWAKYIAHLRKRFPLKQPIYVRTRKIREQGYCLHTHKANGTVDYIEIVISSDLNYLQRIDTLQHEYAHALECAAYGNWDLLNIHSECWGVMFSKVYQACEELELWVIQNGLKEP